MTDDARKPNGRFAPGCPGGPGRPPRAIEMQYLARLSDCITLADWEAICQRAVEAAKAGDAQARAWLSRYLLSDGGNLLRLAAREQLGRSAEDEVAAVADDLAAEN